MSVIDKLSDKFAAYMVTGRNTVKYEPIEGISEDISELKRLRSEIGDMNEEIRRRRVEWDNTFDSILDNIVIVDSKMNITKINNKFIETIKREGGS